MIIVFGRSLKEEGIKDTFLGYIKRATNALFSHGNYGYKNKLQLNDTLTQKPR